MKKKYKSGFLPFWVMLYIVGSFQNEAKAQLDGTWSGTVSMQIKYEGITGRREDQIITSFTNNKGQGTIKSETELIVGGKKLGKSSCYGQGVAELIEVVILPDSTYKIYVIGPECSNGPDPLSNHQNDISIADEPFKGNSNLLSGTRTTVNQLPGDQGKETITLTWNLIRLLDAELIVTPSNYDKWLPEPGKNEATVGSVMNISLKLQGRNGNPLFTKAKAFELHLLNTSQEPGITLNAPLNPIIDLPDLRFMLQPNGEISDDFQSITIPCPGGCTTAAVKIGSYDGGGWTTLRAVAIMEDKSRIIGQLLVTGGTTEILIPKRDPGSKIATSWLNANGHPGERDDKEYSTGNSNDGDGLTAYEEYRGVISEKEFGPINPNKFGRLDPNKKELGVMVKRAEFPLFSEGIKAFEHASFIKVIRFYENEISQDRRLNKNALSATIYKQYVEKLGKGNLSPGVVGENQPKDSVDKVPKSSDRVVIDITQINSSYQAQAAAARRAGVRMPYTLAEDLANTVAHEIAHGVNVNHHGMPYDLPNITVPERSVDIYHIYASDGSEITTRPFQLQGRIGKLGNDESGDLSCIMAYTSEYQWVFRIGPDNSLNYYAIPLLAVGKVMCTSTDGTGINSNNKYFGDASTGNCLGRIKLKD